MIATMFIQLSIPIYGNEETCFQDFLRNLEEIFSRYTHILIHVKGLNLGNTNSSNTKY